MIARVTIHKAKEGKLDEAKAFIAGTSQMGKETGGVMGRYSMQSSTDPLKFVNVTFWKDKETLDNFLKVRMAEAKRPDSPWAWIDGDEYNVTVVTPLKEEV